MLLIDTHAHLNFAAFSADRQLTIKNSLDKGVLMINVGVNLASSRAAVKIAQDYKTGVWAAIGLHPLNLSCQKRISRDLPEDFCEDGFDEEKYFALAKSDKVVAIGEIGLDYYHKPKTEKKFAEMKAAQEESFCKQLLFARKTNLPVIFHCRMAHRQMVEILAREFAARAAIGGAVHCFTGGAKELEEYLNLGLYIGFNGIIFKMNLNEAIKKIPRERILLETDCPYLLPPGAPPRNEPKNILMIAEKIAAIRGEAVESLIAVANRNARELFRI